MATGELAAEVVEEVATNLEEAAVVVRRFDAKVLGFFLLGVGIGAGVGFFLGYRYNKEKLRAEAFAESEKELDKIREVYRAGRVVEKPKPDVEEIVEEKGYGLVEEAARPLPPPVPVYPDASVEPIDPINRLPPHRTEEAEKDKNTGWSYPYELSQRRPNIPFIIHQDEFFSTDENNFEHVNYTYYEGDNVLVDEDDTVLNNRENLIGPTEHLTRFGHGSDDYNVLYIRNSHLEFEVEIVRVPGSYEVEVQGLEDETTYSGNDDDAGSP